MNIEKHFQYWHNNPPPPFNPDYDPTSEKWWGTYCELRRQALILKYKELFPNGEVDGEHFNEVRNSILRTSIDPYNKQYIEQAKRKLHLIA